MKILIVEGIATSGKSSLIDKISGFLGKDRVRVFGESETHEPIMRRLSELHIAFFRSLVNDAVKDDADLVIFDRFHYTQAYRAQVDIARYSEIESLLATQNTFVAYLQVDESAIADRVRLARRHRDKEWGDYVRTKGKTIDEIAQYYITQQRSQLKLLNHSKLTFQVFNTTGHNYQEIAELIINDWYSLPD